MISFSGLGQQEWLHWLSISSRTLTISRASRHDEPVMASFPQNMAKTERRAGADKIILFLFFKRFGSIFPLCFI